ncbi:MAG: ketol-acid reductoisomerase [Methanocellales archaeon]|nr:ketol-acid reductoisomerase [Methanocellales archaeon]MDD3292122.1 ketol-acid reductoisomerase [Methanocellales archaeon]MDD5235359.1 ketol-acid reductoisomerase [Methanocellales archaeon]MDD5485693.1 ketol-acid reductoisomerase [Methanocellales archaeon]
MRIYYDKDGDLSLLKDKTIAIIGYGIQGRGQSLCLRDSGCKVVISELEGAPNFQQAKNDGFVPVPADEAAKSADIIQILTQDHVQSKVYKESIEPALKKGKALCFSHGFNIHFKQIKPPEKVDVFMVAPKGPGALVRKMFEEGKGVPSLVAVFQDATGNALKLALAYAKALGATRAGVIETTFKEETETDLFGEQVDLCGGVTEMIKAAFETLVDAGYQPEVAYFESLHELKLIVDLIHEGGLCHMWDSVSDTAEYGGLTRGKRVINVQSKEAMLQILREIQDGTFAEEWIKENKSNRPVFNALKAKDAEHQIEKVGKKLRAMMPWLRK